MRVEIQRVRAWRGLLPIAATYTAFLLFAQFGFLHQLHRDLGDAGRVRTAMAAMGIAGLAASLGAAWLLGRVSGLRLVRTGLAAVAATAIASLGSHGFAALLAVATATGASLGLLTVAVAASLPVLVPPGAAGRAAGVATGAAYFLCNVPGLFEGDPALRALFPAALAGVAMIFVPRDPEPAPLDRRQDHAAQSYAGFLRLLVTFLVLIWLDSAAFAIVQASPELKALTWGSEGQKLLQGSVHWLAAAGAGVALDAGAGVAVPLAAWASFMAAFPLLQHGGAAAVAAGPIYAAGISFYSTALVVLPSQGRPLTPRWRAGLLYGVAGWLGSALGVGMAQEQGRIPGGFLLGTGAVLALAWLRPPRRTLVRIGRLFGPALALAAAGAAGVWIEALAARPGAAELARTNDQAAMVARGRRVYVEEGCIHCHSQYVRPSSRDVEWWGPARPFDRGERPPLAGARRQGPDLLAVGNRRGEVWQQEHLRDPRRLNPGSRMPAYAYLFAGGGERGRDLVAYLLSLGAGTAVERWALTKAEPLAPPPSPPSAERGAALFASWCAVCHGAAGRGDGPLAARLSDPHANLRKPTFHALFAGPGAEPEEQALARIIRHGLPPTSMPGHEWLTGQQVADLVAFVRTLPARRSR